MRRRHPYAEEPLTFTYKDVVRLLEDAGYERFARHVCQLGEDKTEKNLIEAEWRERYAALLARLHVYEPPPPKTPNRWGKPGPMSDG
jgi:hypothetical protein